MNSKIILGFVLLILLVGGGLFLSQRFQTPPAMEEKKMMEKDTVTSKMDGAMMAKGRYVPYSQAAFDASKDKRRVLYFYAPWCPICRPLDKVLSSNPNQIPEGVVLFRTDYDTENALKTKYGITYQHTFVEVDAAGKAVQTWSGGDVADIVAKLR